MEISEQKFIQKFDDVPSSILIIDNNFQVKFWNRYLEYNSGIKKEEVIGKNLLKVFPQLDKFVFKNRINGIFLGGSPAVFSAQLHKYIIPCRTSDGNFQIHHTVVTAFNSDDSGRNYAAFFIKDITEESKLIFKYRELNKKAQHEISERKKAEASLLESENKLKELITQKDKFFSILAHDLKGPFSGVLGFAEMLINDGDDFSEEEKSRMLVSILNSLKKTYNLLENLLQWSRIQDGRITIVPEKIKFKSFVKEVYEPLEAIANEKNISININVEDEITILADKFMISTVLRNLISNAIKFTHINGVIEVLTTGYIQIIVKDDGVGISKQDIDRLFRIDVQHTTIGTGKETGTGLGLILCKEFIEKHGGSIWVESEINKGSSFLFTLPYDS